MCNIVKIGTNREYKELRYVIRLLTAARLNVMHCSKLWLSVIESQNYQLLLKNIPKLFFYIFVQLRCNTTIFRVMFNWQADDLLIEKTMLEIAIFSY